MSAIVILILLPLLPRAYRGALLLRDALWLAKIVEERGPNLQIEWIGDQDVES